DHEAPLRARRGRHHPARRRGDSRRGRRRAEKNGRGRCPPPGHAARHDRVDGEAPRRGQRRKMSAMEYWSWPPRYDGSYRPEARSRYWFPKRETMDPGERERAIVQRLREVCKYAYERSPFYRAKWNEAGFNPDQVTSLESFERRCPVIRKADLRAAQEREPPFGDYVCVPSSEIFHIHGTSGTTGRPTAFAIARDDWRNI